MSDGMTTIKWSKMKIWEDHRVCNIRRVFQATKTVNYYIRLYVIHKIYDNGHVQLLPTRPYS